LDLPAKEYSSRCVEQRLQDMLVDIAKLNLAGRGMQEEFK
jgi:hypothetical protein